ncbi:MULTISPECIES: alkene reductase [Pseudomonadota]|uniref:alkene reductase n=1 Tax=Pseudomonadota TaxID=1224 RepID=UPI0018C510DB|nr:alkene reductase [Burkholderia vietnamiensis]ELJ2672750.1 alkene reductase [Citrobacter freundii]MBG5193248.1 alkene reductase [Pseudomonas aeruginosa]MBH9642775.1 alkene reductase [Burkholderia vietnamiensis]
MLFTPYRLGELELPNRIVMPPMTRSRATSGNVPTTLMAEYYAQRASAGLIVTEGTQISQQGQGYAWTPGIHSAEQVAGWRVVTDAVHAAGGRIFAQLWHVGRVSHVSLQPGRAAPVSSSPLVADGVKVFIDPDGKGPKAGVGEMVQHSAPQALSEAGIAQVVQDFAAAARNAMAAGFDGVELHGANGYLINQFIDSQANTRTDGYGGSLPNRLRFLREVAEAVIAVVGRERVGVRLAPLTTLQGAVDNTPQATYLGAASLLDDLGVAYLHIAEADWEDAPDMPAAFREALRLVYRGTMIYAGKYTLERAEYALRNGWADLIGFGRPFVANPDLPERLRHGWPLAAPDASRFFGGEAAGYTDYPIFTAQKARTPATAQETQ